MSGAAPQDEQPKHPEDPIERKIAPLTNEVNQGYGNAVIRKGDQTVRDDVQPNDARVPQIAGPVRHEVGRNQLSKKLQTYSSRSLVMAGLGVTRRAIPHFIIVRLRTLLEKGRPGAEAG